MNIAMKEAGGGAVLAGAIRGKSSLTKLLRMVEAEPDRPEPLFLDFAGIEAATASFLRESVIALRDVLRSRDSHYYPVIANPEEAVADELRELARMRGEVFLTCRLTKGGKISGPAIVGNLEAKQRVTFDLVKKHGETDAGELMRNYGEQENLRHTTAWNNRLSALASLGLVVELREGRLKRYRPVLEGA